MPRNHLSWYDGVYSPELRDAGDAYRKTPDWSDQILQAFEKALQDAWSIENFPDMPIPRESVKELRAAIIEGLKELRETLITDQDKAPVPGQSHPCIDTLVSISQCSSLSHFCSSPLRPDFGPPQHMWEDRLEHRIVRLRVRERQLGRLWQQDSMHRIVRPRPQEPQFGRSAGFRSLGRRDSVEVSRPANALSAI